MNLTNTKCEKCSDNWAIKCAFFIIINIIDSTIPNNYNKILHNLAYMYKTLHTLHLYPILNIVKRIVNKTFYIKKITLQNLSKSFFLLHFYLKYFKQQGTKLYKCISVDYRYMKIIVYVY